MTAEFEGKIALVTGASRGIGRAAAIALGEAGAHAILLARTVGGLEETDDAIRKAGGKATLIPCDLSDFAAIDQIGPAIGQRFGRIDILVLNAGILGELAPIPDIAPKTWRQVFDVNVEANWRMLRALDPYLRASEGARVIVMSSRAGGEVAKPFWGAYAASKAALEMLAKTYAEEMRSSGVRVAIIDPGAMRTKMRASAMPGEKPETLPHPSEIAPLILKTAAAAYDGIAERFIRVR
ncbi:MAG: SDR family NAD(P)-dependent oxidoreductase [Parvularculaceae bacterium]|nr:SDR family NAD(P)-dependent oxidoreductase [Parvularculaceae bacterium]